MSEWKRKILNFFQVLFFFAWCIVWMVWGMVSLMLFWNRDYALSFAEKLWAPALLWITGSPMEVTGQDNFDHTKPHIFIMNHQSTLDIAVGFDALRVPLRFLLKEELRWVPFLGQYTWAVGMIFVDRKNKERSRKSIQKAGETIRNGANIIAYPEGTRCQDGRIRQFKKGVFLAALESGVPIVPLAVEGTRHVMPKNTFHLSNHPIKVAIGKPIPTEGLTYEDRDTLIEECRQQMIELHLSIGGVGAEENQPSAQTENSLEQGNPQSA
jgi:1-acyl-sn-glycerol-3-phosphate acyltransferase